MSIIATTDVAINFVSFDDLGDGKGNVTVSFDGAEFTFATNRNDLDAEPSRPEYDRFIKIVVAGDAFDDDDDQNIECIGQPSPLKQEHLAQAARVAREAGDIYIEARNARH